MATKAKLTCVVANPLYPGTPGEYSTKEIEFELNDDPNFVELAKVPVTMDTEVITFEVRSKNWSVDTEATPSPKAKVDYMLSAFGVKQPNGEIYGN